MTHLEKRCKAIQDLPECRTAFNAYRNRRKSLLYQQNKKAKNPEDFLAKNRDKVAKTNAKQRLQDKSGFLAKKRDKQAKTNTKQRLQDRSGFLANKQDKQANNRAKQRSEDKPGFLAKQRKAKLVTRARPFSAQQRFNSFKTATKYGPIFICCCCHRRLFRQSVVQFKENIKQSILKEAPQILDRCIYTDGKIAERLLVDIGKDPQAWLCATCRIYLKQNRMPPMCSQNNLQIHDTNLRAPSELESSFIARNILYMKIGSLPVSRMSVLQGKVVNVPIRPEDQKNTLTKLNNASLPRTPNEACLVLATLKKKMTFNGHYLKQLVDIDLIFQYLDFFKTKGHPYY